MDEYNLTLAYVTKMMQSGGSHVTVAVTKGKHALLSSERLRVFC